MPNEAPERPVQLVPARTIPVPSSVSPEAQAMLELTAPFAAAGRPPLPALDDVAGWRAEREAAESATLSALGMQLPEGQTSERHLDHLRVYEVVPRNLARDVSRVCLTMHGGAFMHGGGEFCRVMGLLTATELGARSWAVDYRMPPDDPYPAALDDGVAAYRTLLVDHRPEDVIFHGASAGGGLAASLALRVRDEGLPLPAAVVLVSPEVDLTESGDSFHANLGVDTVLTGSLMQANLLYAAGHDLRDPYLSAIFGDFSTGYPRTLLTTGTRDLFLSNTVRLHRALRAAGVPAELHVWEAAGHAMFFGGTPEDRDRAREIRRFVDDVWSQRT